MTAFRDLPIRRKLLALTLAPKACAAPGASVALVGETVMSASPVRVRVTGTLAVGAELSFRLKVEVPPSLTLTADGVATRVGPLAAPTVNAFSSTSKKSPKAKLASSSPESREREKRSSPELSIASPLAQIARSSKSIAPLFQKLWSNRNSLAMNEAPLQEH